MDSYGKGLGFRTSETSRQGQEDVRIGFVPIEALRTFVPCLAKVEVQQGMLIPASLVQFLSRYDQNI